MGGDEFDRGDRAKSRVDLNHRQMRRIAKLRIGMTLAVFIQRFGGRVVTFLCPKNKALGVRGQGAEVECMRACRIRGNDCPQRRLNLRPAPRSNAPGSPRATLLPDRRAALPEMKVWSAEVLPASGVRSVSAPMRSIWSTAIPKAVAKIREITVFEPWPDIHRALVQHHRAIRQIPLLMVEVGHRGVPTAVPAPASHPHHA